ncbi:MAG: hydrogenase maturation protease [Gammaproteobacteria bacterium]|nr:hydrogenase maturation protease [Gammaproteobacteria bacterium]
MDLFKNADLSKTAIIGVGSPNEGDRLGWQIVDMLQQNERAVELGKKGMSILKLDRPGVALGEIIRGLDCVLLIDAVKQGEKGLSFIQIDVDQLINPPKQISTHEYGLTESITLLRNLKMRPEKLVIVGVNKVSKSVVTKILNMFIND